MEIIPAGFFFFLINLHLGINMIIEGLRKYANLVMFIKVLCFLYWEWKKMPGFKCYCNVSACSYILCSWIDSSEFGVHFTKFVKSKNCDRSTKIGISEFPPPFDRCPMVEGIRNPNFNGCIIVLNLILITLSSLLFGFTVKNILRSNVLCQEYNPYILWINWIKNNF